jgi:hypothetical protein
MEKKMKKPQYKVDDHPEVILRPRSFMILAPGPKRS